MRLFEVITPPTRVVVTREFSESYSEFLAANPGLDEKFKRFISFKLSGDKLPNDKLFSNGHLSGYWHYHLVRGKIIVIYKQAGNDLRLYIVTDHAGYDGKAGQDLGQWMNRLPDSAFTELDLESVLNAPDASQPLLSIDEKEQVDAQIIDIVAGGGMYIIKPAIERNDWSNFFEWLEANNLHLDQDAVFAAYGGVGKLKEIIRKAIKQYGQQDAYDKA